MAEDLELQLIQVLAKLAATRSPTWHLAALGAVRYMSDTVKRATINASHEVALQLMDALIAESPAPKTEKRISVAEFPDEDDAEVDEEPVWSEYAFRSEKAYDGWLDKFGIMLRPVEDVRIPVVMWDELEDGGIYVAIVASNHPTLQSQKHIHQRLRSMVDSAENELGEKAVQLLEETGDTHVTRVCTKVFTVKKKKELEHDVMAVGDTSALIIEAKTILEPDVVEQVKKNAEKIRALCETGEGKCQMFKGKELRLGVAGLCVTKNVAKAKELLQKCQQEDIFLLLPNHARWSLGDMCYKSPKPQRPSSSNSLPPSAALVHKRVVPTSGPSVMRLVRSAMRLVRF
mmetsp:Transcript_3789/g.8101  ORF Transcript_3789/g.8101 Transcript_3789/m.8101 type:complete len:345 (+) Transcript_3789:220-1254(+)